jgi:hypothetical protein
VPRVAVVGCGDVSIVHFEAIEAIADGELVGVCDSDPATLRAAAARYRVPGFPDHRQLVDAVAPDVVHVCTPHDQHADLAIDCIRAGVGVLVEKPLAHTPAEGDRVVLAAPNMEPRSESATRTATTPPRKPSTRRSSRVGWVPYSAASARSCGVGRRPTIRHGRGGVDGRAAGAG